MVAVQLRSERKTLAFQSVSSSSFWVTDLTPFMNELKSSNCVQWS